MFKIYKQDELKKSYSELFEKYNELEVANAKLLISNTDLDKRLKALEKVNEKLLNYIKNIEEIKQSGGLKTQVRRDYNNFGLGVVDYEMVTIPSIMVAKIIRRYE